MEQKTKNKVIIFLTIFLCLSIIFNFIVMFSMSANNTDWRNEYYKMDTQWCEASNRYIDAINEMLIALSEYDEYYSEIDLLIDYDCWS